jgi:Flp pilus assembly protein TadD
MLQWLLARLPVRPHVWNEIGLDCYAQGWLAMARAAFTRSLAAEGSAAAVVGNLAIVERDLGRLDVAEALCRHALEIDPSSLETLNNLGSVLEMRERFPEALECYYRSFKARPGFVHGQMNHAALLQKLGRVAEARDAYDALLATHPGAAQARLHRAMLLLQSGIWQEGWREYESRFEVSARAARDIEPPVSSAPRWNGEPLLGKRILLRGEQGLGDVVQFIRYAAVLRNSGATVLVSAQPQLVPLLSKAAGVAGVKPRRRETSLAPFDFWTPLLSVGRFLTPTESEIPGDIPYLEVPAPLVRAWSSRLSGQGARLRVGFAWAGNPQHDNDRYRSLHGARLAPLRCGRVSYVALGAGVPPQTISEASLQRLAKPRDVLELAAIVANLDLVITVDTLFAHLAGALGRPVWMLLPANSDWRWMLGRSDSPWYPTMRLYRQTRLGDWDEVIARVAADLDRL